MVPMSCSLSPAMADSALLFRRLSLSLSLCLCWALCSIHVLHAFRVCAFQRLRSPNALRPSLFLFLSWLSTEVGVRNCVCECWVQCLVVDLPIPLDFPRSLASRLLLHSAPASFSVLFALLTHSNGLFCPSLGIRKCRTQKRKNK